MNIVQKVDDFQPPEPAMIPRRLNTTERRKSDGERFLRKMGSLLAEAKVTGLIARDLRRTYVSRLLKGGAEVSTVKRLPGHSSLIRAIRHYSRVTDADERRAIEKLAAVAAG